MAISNSKKFRKSKFAKLFCVLIFPEVKNNDSNDTLDDEVQKAVLYTQSYFFLKEMDAIFTILHTIKCVISNILRLYLALMEKKTIFYS